MQKASALSRGSPKAAYHHLLRPAGKAATQTPAMAARHMAGAEKRAAAIAQVAGWDSVPGASKRNGTVINMTSDAVNAQSKSTVSSMAAATRNRMEPIWAGRAGKQDPPAPGTNSIGQPHAAALVSRDMTASLPLITTALLFVVAATDGARAQTQTELNKQAEDEFQTADQDMNTAYGKILAAYADDQSFISSLRAAQRCWIAFRDAQLKMKYPDREPGYYGSIQPVCEANYLAELTRERTKALQAWLDGATEGDTCAGSIRVAP